LSKQGAINVATKFAGAQENRHTNRQRAYPSDFSRGLQADRKRRRADRKKPFTHTTNFLFTMRLML
jgi:hypothetical protein